ncbi:MAG: hypothetical protein ACD_8C00092G0013 [uncultured bacterium]|nr:MAG: hypothetical protein ACD_8C00092G0013 [uncultured bacterium]
MSKKVFVLALAGIATVGAISYASGAFAFGENRMGRGAGFQQKAVGGQNRNVDSGQCGRGQGKAPCNMGTERGQNKGGNFVDANKDGICDRMQ